MEVRLQTDECTREQFTVDTQAFILFFVWLSLEGQRVRPSKAFGVLEQLLTAAVEMSVVTEQHDAAVSACSHSCDQRLRGLFTWNELVRCRMLRTRARRGARYFSCNSCCVRRAYAFRARNPSMISTALQCRRASQVPAGRGRMSTPKSRKAQSGASACKTLAVDSGRLALIRRMRQLEGAWHVTMDAARLGHPASEVECTTRPRLNFGTEPDAQRRLSRPSCEKHNGVLHRGLSG